MQVLTVMIKPVSGQCNMSCDYCFYFDKMAHRSIPNRGLMTEDTLRIVIEKKQCLRRKDAFIIPFKVENQPFG